MWGRNDYQVSRLRELARRDELDDHADADDQTHCGRQRFNSDDKRIVNVPG